MSSLIYCGDLDDGFFMDDVVGVPFLYRFFRLYLEYFNQGHFIWNKIHMANVNNNRD